MLHDDSQVLHDDSQVLHDDPKVLHDDPKVLHDDPKVPHDDPKVPHDDPKVPHNDPKVPHNDLGDSTSPQEPVASRHRLQLRAPSCPSCVCGVEVCCTLSPPSRRARRHPAAPARGRPWRDTAGACFVPLRALGVFVVWKFALTSAR